MKVHNFEPTWIYIPNTIYIVIIYKHILSNGSTLDYDKHSFHQYTSTTYKGHLHNPHNNVKPSLSWNFSDLIFSPSGKITPLR